MISKLYVRLSSEEREALKLLAQSELRPPIEQARFIIRAELYRRGLLPEDAAINQPFLKTQS